VTARVKEYVSYRVSVLGEVEKPDVYALTGGRTVLDVIARAGGLTDNASKTVTLVRPGDKENINYVIDLERLVTTQDPKINMILKPGDVVYVPKAGSIFVDGFVNQPGAFPLTSKITVTQAIAMAGGTAPEANTSSVYVYRLTENGDRKPLKVSLNDIREGKIGDPYLEENDVVLVTGSGFKRFVSGFLKFFGIGFSSASGASSYKVGIGK
jgi:polysaccharide export outer membrane protein